MTGPAGKPKATDSESGLPDQRDAEAPPAPGDEDEVVRLRAAVAELQAQLAAQPASAPPVPPGPRQGRWRPWVAGVLIACGALLAPLSIVAAWAHDQVADTDRYVESITPLGSDPAVQDAIIDRITTEIFTRIDVEGVTEEAVDALAAQGLSTRVSDSLKALATPIAGGIRNFVTEQVTRIVKSPEFEQAWVAANREAHTQMVAVLTGEGTSAVDVTGNTVSLNLAVIIKTVKAQLVNAGFELAARIPEVNAQFTIFESEDLTKVQAGFRLLENVARGLPFVGLLLIGAGVYVARSRRRALMAAGLAVAGSMLLLGATLNAFRPIYLDAIPADQLPHGRRRRHLRHPRPVHPAQPARPGGGLPRGRRRRVADRAVVIRHRRPPRPGGRVPGHPGRWRSDGRQHRACRRLRLHLPDGTARGSDRRRPRRVRPGGPPDGWLDVEGARYHHRAPAADRAGGPSAAGGGRW